MEYFAEVDVLVFVADLKASRVMPTGYNPPNTCGNKYISWTLRRLDSVNYIINT